MTFVDMKNLTHVLVDSNQLQTIEALAFNRLPQLQLVSLQVRFS